ncbi:MAG: hypothetical protein CMF49_04855 [Legionellales bacterium]|nr:hypothetical protein [Legionellales bacterium]|tara:strand:+ start:55 stop:957 length:903 start_codon:yes stop_codon:yes gene_type:complete
MENTNNYFRIGLFVIGFTVVFIILCLWLSVGLSGKTYKTYVVYMKESVSGLSDKAPVKYNGVEIGYVANVSLYKKDPALVTLKLAIESQVPIYTDTRAILETQGLTGIAYIELQGGEKGAKQLHAQVGEKYPVIKSSPSLLFRLDNALDDLTHNLNDISSGLKTVLNKQNTEAVRDIIQNFKFLSDNLKNNSKKLNLIIDNTSKASNALPRVMHSVEESAKSVQNISAKLSRTSDEADKTMQAASATVQHVNNQLLPQIQASVQTFQSTMTNLKDFSGELDANPSIIIRGKAPAVPGPGE